MKKAVFTSLFIVFVQLNLFAQGTNKRLFDAVIAADGTGNYTTVQAAIDAAPENRTTPWLIFIKNGSYKGTVLIPQNKPFIHLIGQDKEKTIIHEKINQEENNSSAAWAYSFQNPSSPVYDKDRVKVSVVRINGKDFYAENISFVNDWGVEMQAGPQALAMYTSADKSAFYNCNFRSFQDTWRTAGGINDRTYVYRSLIEGAVDYFYGAGDAYVEETTLYNVRSGSVIVAPNHKPKTKWGYVFNNCVVDGNAASNNGNQKLGRPWNDEPIAVYLNTTMKISIHPEGWADMGTAPKLFAEYNSMDVNGKSLDLSKRKTSYTYDGNTTTGLKAALTAQEAAKYTYKDVISGSDGWNPRSLLESTKAPIISSSNGKITWNAVEYAICYIVLRDDKVVHFTIDNNYTPVSDDANKKFAVFAVAESGALSSLSNAVTYSLMPTVSVMVPANNAVFSPGQTISIKSTATAISGASLKKVEFYAGSTKLGEDTVSPYEYGWANPPAGVHTITAKATDNSGASTTSAGVNIIIGAYIGSGNFIDSLVLFDPANAAAWSISNNFRAGTKVFGDRDFVAGASIPAGLQGAEWVSTSMATRTLTPSDRGKIIQFKMKKSGYVNILHEDRVAAKPAWIATAGFISNGQKASVIESAATERIFTVYSRKFNSGETVSIGANSVDGTTTSMMYLVAFTEETSVPILGNALHSTHFSLRPLGGSTLLVETSSPTVVDIFDLEGNIVSSHNVESSQILRLSLRSGVYFVKARGMCSIKFVAR